MWSPASLAALNPFFLSPVPNVSSPLPPRCPFQTQEGGWGLDGVLKDHAWKLRGIVNGMDYQEWSPVGDVHLQVGRGGGLGLRGRQLGQWGQVCIAGSGAAGRASPRQANRSHAG